MTVISKMWSVNRDFVSVMYLVYLFQGGITIVIVFDEQTEFHEDGELFLVFSGTNQRHIVSAKQVNKHTLHAFVPGEYE